jgi:hypothetical protein
VAANKLNSTEGALALKSDTQSRSQVDGPALDRSGGCSTLAVDAVPLEAWRADAVVDALLAGGEELVAVRVLHAPAPTVVHRATPNARSCKTDSPSIRVSPYSSSAAFKTKSLGSQSTWRNIAEITECTKKNEGLQ